jgi:hypothetical protein
MIIADNDTTVADERPRCVECGATAPRTGTNYTLISASFGWRLSRRTVANRVVMEWRCSTCFDRFKQAQKATRPAPRAAR